MKMNILKRVPNQFPVLGELVLERVELFDKVDILEKSYFLSKLFRKSFLPKSESI